MTFCAVIIREASFCSRWESQADVTHTHTHTHSSKWDVPIKSLSQCSGNPEEETAQGVLELKGTWWIRSSKLTEQSSNKLRKTETWGLHGPLVYVIAFSWGFCGTFESVKEWVSDSCGFLGGSFPSVVLPCLTSVALIGEFSQSHSVCGTCCP